MDQRILLLLWQLLMVDGPAGGVREEKENRGGEKVKYTVPATGVVPHSFFR